MNAWTEFWDMHSGGYKKLQWEHIYIEAPEAVAVRVFDALFNHDPYNVTCDCCGGDYAISEYPSLEKATEYQRKERTVETYLTTDKNVKVVRASEFPKNVLLDETDLL